MLPAPVEVPFFVYSVADGNRCQTLLFSGDRLRALISDDMINDAGNFRIDDAYILYDEGAGIPADMTAAALTTYMKSKATPDYTDIKAAITFGTPVIFGSFIPASFFAARSSFWEPTYDEKQNPGQAVLSNEGCTRCTP